MRFGPVPTAQAIGAILAHSMEAMDPNAKRYRIRKGCILTLDDVAGLSNAGHRTVVVARLDADDVHEDAAATRLARALVPAPDTAGLTMSPAATGRVNVYAQVSGVAQINVSAITRFNQIDPMVTVATLPNLRRVAEGDMVATIKIISYAVPARAVGVAEDVGAALSIAPPVYQTATLIETTTGGTALPDKGRRAMAGRLQRLGVTLTPRVIVPHDMASIQTALAAADSEIVLILTASATSDPHDVAPEAVRQAGGAVTRFGMPVDPGNLLFVGDVRGRPVIGLPGCARSPVLNGADWVLERVICGVPVGDAEIAAMGVGGLLKESPARIHPRDAG